MTNLSEDSRVIDSLLFECEQGLYTHAEVASLAIPILYRCERRKELLEALPSWLVDRITANLEKFDPAVGVVTFGDNSEVANMQMKELKLWLASRA